ncbi:XdhC family protein [Agrobacterium larrymoorei]|uniref:Xanthine dehydrogenase accessory factor n=1 Tax=Agrobacterium larrymoorei TaxID=160699 RepID=A0ABU0UHL2_9HYPH|nr:XdhC family protein [Agrobacterium larrymoorei]MDQ1184436.1 xanthine dehydrogenase accessory factor [Agrobacterium larrymoorei]
MSASISTALPVPVRANSSDDPAEILRFALDALDRGRAALATLVEIRGGAARSLGAHLAVSSDGHYCGYLSGGCIEAAVAAEALEAIAVGADRVVTYGEGSPFFDIVLPCGGGVTIAIHVLHAMEPLETVLYQLSARRTVALSYDAKSQAVTRSETVPPRSGWYEGDFLSVYRPQTRVVISGQTAEAEAVSRLAQASGYEVQLLSSSRNLDAIDIDTFTAVVLLHHDLDLEAVVLDRALQSPAFYIGALGSTRSHRRRTELLRTAGVSSECIDRIRAPIGLFGPTRDAASLALSVLADVAAARLETFPP